ncbi:hypothetical protein Nepgr_026005 [Nepenthes gracilis]|uniref:Uncharacterized protein n=1 Tax=Nepenthes gracilis TaxID=150966 RepID=A0AAD3Y005_NEPGR|nr:hypothetical protein Nepgr_026005 [Nepenthes gracilis]
MAAAGLLVFICFRAELFCWFVGNVLPMPSEASNAFLLAMFWQLCISNMASVKLKASVKQDSGFVFDMALNHDFYELNIRASEHQKPFNSKTDFFFNIRS